MKVVVQKENLRKAIGFVERATSKNTSLPILGNILLKTDAGRLFLTATNLEIGIVAALGAKIEQEGSIAVPGRVLADFIRGVTSDTISLSTKQNTLHVSAGSFKTTILSFDPSEYPIVPKIHDVNPNTISADVLRNLIGSAVDSTALSESRPELAGAFLQITPNSITLAATDGFRLVEHQNQNTHIHPLAAIVPRATLLELLRILGDIDGDIQIFHTDNQIAFTHTDVELVSRLIDGRYPDYRKVIPERSISRVLVYKNQLENAIKTAALFSSSISDIKISCADQIAVISAKNSNKGEAEASLDANIKGDPFEVTVNYHYFLDGLKVMPTETVIMEFTGTGGPCVLRPSGEKKDLVYVIMPLRN